MHITSDNQAFVVFIDAFAMFSLDPGSSMVGTHNAARLKQVSADVYLEESVSLRSSNQRFLGFSSPDLSQGHRHTSLSLLTSFESIMSVKLSTQQRTSAVAENEAWATRKLRVKIEQAIFFGTGDDQNPLAFDLPPNVDGDLVAASESVSSNLLASSRSPYCAVLFLCMNADNLEWHTGSTYQPSILDLRVQLTDRLQRSKALIEFIGFNGLLPRVSPACHLRLLHCSFV